MEFCFQTSAYHMPSFIRQVSVVLDKRTERISRQAYPKLWAVTDRLAARKVSEKVRKKRYARYRVYGFLLVAMGVFLLVPGLMEPNGAAFLLLAGIAGIAAGAFTLWQSRPGRQPHARFDKAASALLQPLQSAPPALVKFTPQGMLLGDRPAVPYDAFDCVAETEDLFVLTWNGKVTLLQKKDITAGDIESFRTFLQARVKPQAMLG